jgi:hypothetical protein
MMISTQGKRKNQTADARIMTKPSSRRKKTQYCLPDQTWIYPAAMAFVGIYSPEN